MLPLFGPEPAGGASLTDAWPERLALAVGCIAAIIFGGRYLVRPVFLAIDVAKSRELFSAAALVIVVGVVLRGRRDRDD